jgi:hypothetical protein
MASWTRPRYASSSMRTACCHHARPLNRATIPQQRVQRAGSPWLQGPYMAGALPKREAKTPTSAAQGEEFQRRGERRRAALTRSKLAGAT